MITRVKTEDEVVQDQTLRRRIIEEINGSENQRRKDEAYRRNLCNKDKTKSYVVRELLKQFDDETVREMNYSISNVSIARKIIDKLARVYSNGVLREGADSKQTEVIENVAKATGLNRVMKQTNRYLRTHKNTMVGVLPCPVVDVAGTQYDIKVQAFQPHLYDVIEDYNDREKPMWVILSNYKPVDTPLSSIDAARADRGATKVMPTKKSDGKDQAIADQPEDANAEDDHYIWWSKHYHFTTNAKGEFISANGEPVESSQDIMNPIQKLNFVNFAIDQEGQFWADGGDDVFDGAVHVNCMITNMQHIGVTQGYGQFFMKGKNLPRHIKMGPNKAIIMEVENNDEPSPEIGFASSSPKLQELKDQVIMYVALLLTTNNLSTKAVAAELSGGQDFASGISLIIDKAESIEDVQDQRDVFYQNEPKIFDIIASWQEVYRDALTDDLKANMLPQDLDLKVKFNDSRPIMSEKEKLENIKLRKDLGISSMIELLMQDDPSLTQQQAEEKLMKLLEDKMRETAMQAEMQAKLNPQADQVDGEGSEDNFENEPEGEMTKKGKYYEDENGDLWEEQEDGSFKKVAAKEVPADE